MGHPCLRSPVKPKGRATRQLLCQMLGWATRHLILRSREFVWDISVQISSLMKVEKSLHVRYRGPRNH